MIQIKENIKQNSSKVLIKINMKKELDSFLKEMFNQIKIQTEDFELENKKQIYKLEIQ